METTMVKKGKHKKYRNKYGTQITNLCRKNGNNYGTHMKKMEKRWKQLWTKNEKLWQTNGTTMEHK